MHILYSDQQLWMTDRREPVKNEVLFVSNRMCGLIQLFIYMKIVPCSRFSNIASRFSAFHFDPLPR